MRRLPASDPTSTGERQCDERSEGGHQRRKTIQATSHADLLELGYQPLMNSVAIRRCPLLYKNAYNRHTPVTERSVALHAPRLPKCPHSAVGSKHPRYWADQDEVVPKYWLAPPTLGSRLP
jgi:hypothetical protein